MTDKPILSGPRVMLRDATADDIAARFEIGNDAQVQRMYGVDPTQVRPITLEAAEAWVRSQQEHSTAWVIEAKGRLIGAVRLHSIDQIDKRCSLAIGLLSSAQTGNGYGPEAIRVLAAHAFGTMGLHRLGCRVLGFNDRAVAAYEKVGFKIEGRERESCLIAGRWHDDVLMGLLDRELIA